MTIQVKWLVENHVMFVKFSDFVDAEQIYQYLDKSMAMRDKAIEVNGEDGALVHTITDSLAVTEQNIDMKTAYQIMKSLKQQRIGWSIQVTDNRLDRFTSAMAHQFGGIRFQSFTTVEDAVKFLRDGDALLADKLGDNLDFSFPDDE